MDTRISPGGARADVVNTETAPRVTPRSGIPFRDMVSRGAGAIVRGAEAAITSLPGAPIVAAAVRGGPATPGGMTPMSGSLGSSALQPNGLGPLVPSGALGTAEAPAGATGGGTGGTTGAPGAESSSIEQTLAQTQEFNLYYLQLQEQMAAENRSYSAMSNVLKARHDTVKNAIGNIR